MTNRELLELAAKAACIQIGRYAELIDDYYSEWNGQSAYELTSSGYWNPLEDDGDALRLAVKLGLRVCIDNRSKFTWVKGAEGSTEHRNDASAATRRAIVRAAAEIGKAIP